MEKRRLNLGCGDVFHTDWTNIDVLDSTGKLLKYNLNLGIPFCDDTFDFVYHSHIIEHFTHKRGRFFLEECFRVLKDGGIFRIAFPDLEAIARNYVKALDDIKAGVADAQARRRWMTIELYDQIVREKSGGEMLEFMRQQPVPIADFVISRMGKDTAGTIEFFKMHPQPLKKELLTATTLDYNPFKNCGECHKWMYDFYALKETLEEIGFRDVNKMEYNTSCDEDYLKYNFDQDNEGHIRKPDSCFIEAKKPQSSNNERKIKVAIFNAKDFDDSSVNVLRKHKALRKIGVKSQVYTGFQKYADTAVQIAPLKNIGFVNGKNGEVYLESYYKKQEEWKNKNYIDKHFKAERLGDDCYLHDDTFNINDVMFINDFDIINLENVMGFLDPSVHPEYFNNRRIVWTLHDMKAMTGGCDFSVGCEAFKDKCGSCPLLEPCKKTNPIVQCQQLFDYDLSYDIFQDKLASYRKLNLHIVADSNYLANQVKESALLSNFPVTVIRNGVPLDVYKPFDRQSIRASLGISPNDIVLQFIADGSRTSRNGTKYIFEMLKQLSRTEFASSLLVLMRGKNLDGDISNTGIRTHVVTSLENEDAESLLYNASDALLYPYLEDSAPKEIAESLACGTPVIAFNGGGIPEMINHETTGWLARAKDVQDLCLGIKWLISTGTNNFVRTQCRNFAVENFDEIKQAQKYNELYKKLSVK